LNLRPPGPQPELLVSVWSNSHGLLGFSVRWTRYDQIKMEHETVHGLGWAIPRRCLSFGLGDRPASVGAVVRAVFHLVAIGLQDEA
jgi:hypothetical protein